MTTEDKILNTALLLFISHGYEVVSMSHIAKEASINKATIYHYFKSKEELYNQVFESTLKTFFTHVKVPSSTPPLEKLKQYITKLVQIDINVLKMIARQQIEGTNNLNDTNFKNLNTIKNSFEIIYKEGIISGAFRMLDPYLLFEILFGAVTQYRFSASSLIRNDLILIEELNSFIVSYAKSY